MALSFLMRAMGFLLRSPTMDPVISGTITMFLRWVLTTSGFSLAGASFFFFLSFLMRAMGFLLSPLENFLLILQTKRKPMALIKKLRKKKKEAPANEKPAVCPEVGLDHV